MLDIKYILEHADEIRSSITHRQVHSTLDAVLDLHQSRKEILLKLEQTRAQANRLAKNLAQIEITEREAFIAEGRGLNQSITQLEETLREIDQAYQEAMLGLPNRLAKDTPLGVDDSENVIIREFLTPPVFEFKPKDHVELAQTLDLIDFESGTKVTGPKFYFLKNQAVFLELALKLFVLKLATQAGYTPLITPDLAKKSILIGTGYSPRGDESNIYNLEDLDLSLIATAEITVGGIHADELLDEANLPLKYVAESHCFRREAGSGGRESKGLYRVHQFSKIELFQITTPETADAALEEILHFEESIYQQLKLPYRVMRICAGDLGAPAFKKYDIEVWMPGRDSKEKYGEVTSASHCTDFQSRRLGIRYRNGAQQKTYPHTLNGTAIAVSRTLLAILENYQQADGSILIPEVLQTYMGESMIKAPKHAQ